MVKVTMIDLSIVIVNINTRDLLRACLKSVYEENPDISFEILVCDNASTDGSVEMLREEFPGVKVTASEENLGFARGNNRILPQATGRYIVLLNPDTEIKDQALQRLVDYLDANPKVGAVAPQLMLPDGTNQGGHAGYDPTPARLFVFAFMLHSVFPNVRGFWLTKQDYKQSEIEVDWLSGACFMVRAPVIGTAGTLSDSYYMYAEDIEWGNRIRQAGWKLVLLSNVQILHHHGAAAKKKQGGYGKLGIKGLDVYYRSRYPHHKVFLMHMLAAIGFMLRAGIWLVISILKSNAAYRQHALDMWSAALASFQQLCAVFRKQSET